MRYKLCRCGSVREDVFGSVCAKCGAGRKRNSRTTKECGYDNEWRVLSEKKRSIDPLCELCLQNGIITAADEVHHKVRIDDAPWLRLVWENLLSVCVDCHIKQHAEMAAHGAPGVG